ncbi:ribonuclease HII [Candidatus Woesearchaeota archaeon]|nr:ribonuclease HII [Candidatus Woesearchaeota archaeon]
MTLICGVDEAGRGPVIGPLVICGVVFQNDKEAELDALGVKDSKLLTPRQRERIAGQLKQIVQYHWIVIEPAEIDAAVLSSSTNLNWLEADKTALILNKLKPETAYIDCPSNNLGAYHTYLQNKVTAHVVVEHQAEQKHLVVAAASILAKVERDRLIDELKKQVGEDFGSGYPSDPKTVAFLQKHFKKHASLFRKSWASYQRLQQKTLV